MFTGIIEELGEVVELAATDDGARLTIRAPKAVSDAGHGDSISVSGVCLTVVDQGPDWFTADVMGVTIDMSTLGGVATGDRVNIERAMQVGDRLGGHIVQGHVDAVGEIVEGVPELRIRMPLDLMKYVVVKGSVTVDGVSLTVVDVLDDGFTVAVIPHTADVTTLGRKGPGDAVNLEVDVTVKYVERLLTWKDS